MLLNHVTLMGAVDHCHQLGSGEFWMNLFFASCRISLLVSHTCVVYFILDGGCLFLNCVSVRWEHAERRKCVQTIRVFDECTWDESLMKGGLGALLLISMERWVIGVECRLDASLSVCYSVSVCVCRRIRNICRVILCVSEYRLLHSNSNEFKAH